MYVWQSPQSVREIIIRNTHSDTYTGAVDGRDKYDRQLEHAEYEADYCRAQTFLNCLNIIQRAK